MFAFHGKEPSRKPDLVMTLLVYAMAPSYAFESKAVWRKRNTFSCSLSKSYLLTSCNHWQFVIMFYVFCYNVFHRSSSGNDSLFTLQWTTIILSPLSSNLTSILLKKKWHLLTSPQCCDRKPQKWRHMTEVGIALSISHKSCKFTTSVVLILNPDIDRFHHNKGA